MLHIATLHFKSFRWISIQLRELRRNIRVPYTTWASLEEIDRAHGASFDNVFDHIGSHAEKLNRLAAEIEKEAADDDLIMFLDGDAFPIADPMPLIESGLAKAPLMAVQREENQNDPQPHPCFCVTRVSTWKSVPGDWSVGDVSTASEGHSVSDVGGELLRRLEATGTPWTTVMRSNRHNLHPVFFGIYGDAIYHHGAGFRRPITRADLMMLGAEGKPGKSTGIRLALQNLQLSQALFRRIERDDPEWLASLR